MPDLVRYVLLIAATFAAYLPAVRGGMLWDDDAHITRVDLRSLHGLWRIWFDPGATQQYYPLLHSAFWMEHSLWGGSVAGYHLVNIALHAAAACLLVRIVARLALPGRWLAGLLFALHPQAVEAVAWISEQKSTLSAVFCLAAALVYLEFDESRRPSRYLAALALFVLALLSKTVTATLPAVLLVLVWWRRGRIEWRRDVRPLVPWSAVGIPAGLFTAWVERTYIGAQGAEFGLSALQRVLLAGRALAFYGWKTVWPVDLAFFYPRWDVDASVWWQYLFPAGVLLVAAALIGMARRHRGPLAAFLVFAATLFPALGFFNVYPFRYSFVAGHFAYLAMAAILVPAAALMASRLKPWISAVVVLGLALLTWREAGVYRDSETLYRATLARNPDAWLARNNLANLLLASGRRDEALQQVEEVLRRQPDFWEAHLTLGNALIESPGGLARAIGEYETAARLAPHSERAHTNLGNALLLAGRVGEAIAQLQEALRIDPGNAEAHNDLGNAFSQLPGRLAEATAEYEAALRGNPDFPEAHNNLGRALAQSGQLPDAVAQFEEALRLRPDYANAHSNLGIALSQIPGRLEDAIAEYRTALRLRPDSAAFHNNLGYALARMPGRMAEAIAEYREALRLRPDYAEARYNLEAALGR